MAGPYGSAFTGGYKRSPLAEAMANAGGLLGQGLQQGTENFVAGQEHQDQLAEQEKDRALKEKQFVATEVNRIEGEYNDAVANGGDPEEAARRRDEELAKIPGYKPPAQPQARPTPPPSAAPTPPQAPSPERSPGAQLEAPDYEMGSLGVAPQPPAAPVQAERPPIAEAMNSPDVKAFVPPAAPKSFGQIQAEGIKRKEGEKFERDRMTRIDTKLQDEGYQGYKDKVPGLDQFDVSTWGGANAALGVLQEFKDREKAAQREKEMRIAAGKSAYENEQALRREYNGRQAPYQETLDKVVDVEETASLKTPQGDNALLNTYAKILSPGIVSDKDLKNAANPGGPLEKWRQEVELVTTGRPLNDEQRERVLDAIRALATSAKRNKARIDGQYRDLATGYFGAGAAERVVGKPKVIGKRK
jgi:hypothetical protein